MPGIEGLPLGNTIWADPDLKTSYNILGKTGFQRKDGYDKASGRAVYTRDLKFPGMLYGVYLTSPYAHAKITKIDTTAAAKYPGIRAILTYDDVDVKGKGSGQTGMPYLWLGDTAYYSGQTLGAVVVADSEQIAREALKLLKVDWTELGFVIDPQEAAKSSAPLVNPDRTLQSNDTKATLYKLGDVQAGFAASDKTIEFSGFKNQIAGAGAEPVSCVVKWDGQGKLECWFHCQIPGVQRAYLANFFGLTQNNVLTHMVYQGCMNGQFNWVGSVWYWMPSVTALLAKRTGRPVKLLYDRRDDYISSAVEYIRTNLKVGFKNDGTILAVKGDNYGGINAWQSYEHLVENTRIPNIEVQPHNVLCNVPQPGAMRCEQVNNIYVLSSVCDHVATELSMDPTLLASKNDGYEGEDLEHLNKFKAAHGFPVRDSLAECIAKGKATFGWDAKWHAPNTRKLANGRMHGVGFIWTHEWQDASGDASIAVALSRDGSANIMAQHADIGVNHRSAISQVVAEELGLKYEAVDFMDRGHNTQMFEMEPPAGSSSFTCNAYAAKYAARKARASLLDFVTHDFHYSTGFGGAPTVTHAKALFPGKTAAELDIKDGVIFEIAKPDNKLTVAACVARAGWGGSSAGAQGMAAGIFGWQFITQPARVDGDSKDYKHIWLGRSCYFVEVEVDIETGEYFVTKWTAVNDMGKIVSPETVAGQNYGGQYMTWGRAYLEEYIWDPATGIQINPDLIDYKVATIKDLLPSTIANETIETGSGWGPYGAIGCGELTATNHWTAIGPAIYNAIGKRIEDYPITPAKVLKALGKA